MFAFVIDPTNVLGPRKATEADAKNHPEAWERFTATLERPSSQAEAAESAVPVEPEASPQDTAPAAVVSDAPKRRGRPPKVVAAQ
ncbi:hypothetical protein [Phenylobacterium soli]|nr:hypothetical protein [Phenylobacterium soli]